MSVAGLPSASNESMLQKPSAMHLLGLCYLACQSKSSTLPAQRHDSFSAAIENIRLHWLEGDRGDAPCLKWTFTRIRHNIARLQHAGSCETRPCDLSCLVSEVRYVDKSCQIAWAERWQTACVQTHLQVKAHRSAPVRLMPRPPTLVVSRNTNTASLELKSSTSRARTFTAVLPSMRWYARPAACAHAAPATTSPSRNNEILPQLFSLQMYHVLTYSSYKMPLVFNDMFETRPIYACMCVGHTHANHCKVLNRPHSRKSVILNLAPPGRCGLSKSRSSNKSRMCKRPQLRRWPAATSPCLGSAGKVQCR